MWETEQYFVKNIYFWFIYVNQSEANHARQLPSSSIASESSHE